MTDVALRRIAQVNPPTPEFDELTGDDLVTFMPLEAVWSDHRLDTSARRAKADVSTGYTRFRGGDVIVPKVSPTFEHGRSAVMDIDGVGAGTTELHVLRATAESDRRYLAYVVRAKHFLEEGETAYEGVAGLRRVSSDFVASFRVPHLAVDEQRRIADYLDDQVARLDNVMATRARQSLLLHGWYDSFVSERLSREGEMTIPLRRLIAEAVVGIVVQPAALYTDEGGVPALRGLDVRERTVSRSGHVSLTHEGHAANPRSHLREGDVVVVRTGDAGAAAQVPAWAVGWNCIDLLVVRAASNTLPQFLELAINAAKTSGEIGNASSGALHQHFGVGALRDLEVARLSLERQKSICADASAAWAAMNEGREALSRSVRLLDEYKQALITGAVTGEFDVATASDRSIPA